mgnify:CR=1 FL=1
MIGIVSALGVFIGGLYLTTMIVDSTMSETNIKDYAVWIILAIWAIVAGVAGWFMTKKKMHSFAEWCHFMTIDHPRHSWSLQSRQSPSQRLLGTLSEPPDTQIAVKNAV